MFSFHRSYFEIDFGKMCIGTDCQACIIYISFTNKDVVYFCLQNVEQTNQIILINFILALSHTCDNIYIG